MIWRQSAGAWDMVQAPCQLVSASSTLVCASAWQDPGGTSQEKGAFSFQCKEPLELALGCLYN